MERAEIRELWRGDVGQAIYLMVEEGGECADGKFTLMSGEVGIFETICGKDGGFHSYVNFPVEAVDAIVSALQLAAMEPRA
jgi:hypothetical protein